MNQQSIFYYPYASFSEKHPPILKAIALYFDKIYMLDPEKASGGRVGTGEIIKDIILLENENLIERIAPENVLFEYEELLTEMIRDDLRDQRYLELCNRQRNANWWTIALAKIPKQIREDPKYKPTDQAMQRILGEKARALAPEIGRYIEDFRPPSIQIFDETRRGEYEEIEYRYVDVPLALGESIMINHALIGSMLYKDATPLTDNHFHNQVLAYKIERAKESPVLRDILEERAQQNKFNIFAASAILDKQLDLPILSPMIPLEEILEYRRANKNELEEVRLKLNLLARRTKEEAWTPEFYDTVDQILIPDLIESINNCKKVQEEWVNGERNRRIIDALGISVAAAGIIVPLVLGASPFLTLSSIIAVVLNITKDVSLPGAKWALDYKKGKKELQKNGLQYLLGPAGNKKKPI